MRRKPASERIQEVVEQWFLKEPALFLAWTTHHVRAEPKIASVRVGRGKIEYNPLFFDALDAKTLAEVMRVEATRILLKHPYERQMPNAAVAFAASNLTIKEHLPTSLPLPRAVDVFGDREHDAQFFEYYYKQLLNHGETEESGSSGALDQSGGSGGSSSSGGSDESDGEQNPLACYRASGEENARDWDEDLLQTEQINVVITEIERGQDWGSLPGNLREHILATLRPKVDYRKLLRAFRASILSSQRRLTRMKPNRRYGFAYMGSRREFSTNLLMAVDVSGSVSSQDVRVAFSIVNRLFKYGIEGIDVIQFDTEVRGKPLELKRARHEVQVLGRGGTDFQPVMDYLDEHPGYDGLILFTDGYAPMPDLPRKNRRTRILWLFNQIGPWSNLAADLAKRGMVSAYVANS